MVSFSFLGRTEKLLHRNNDYELWEDLKDNLQYVRLSDQGTRKIVKRYEQQYNLHNKIEVITINAPNLETHYADSHTNSLIADAINDRKHSVSGSKGFIFCVKNKNGYVAHSFPVIIDRVSNNDFSIKSPDDIIGIDSDQVEKQKYNSWQKDYHSCTVFAVNWMKHKLFDKSDNLHFKQSVKTAQDHIKPKYVDSDLDINAKAIFKGHDYARRLQSKHRELLNDKTKTLLEKIDKQRGKDHHLSDTQTKNTQNQQTTQPSIATKSSLILASALSIGGIVSAALAAPLVAIIGLFSISLMLYAASAFSHNEDIKYNKKSQPPLIQHISSETSQLNSEPERKWQERYENKVDNSKQMTRG